MITTMDGFFIILYTARRLKINGVSKFTRALVLTTMANVINSYPGRAGRASQHLPVQAWR